MSPINGEEQDRERTYVANHSGPGGPTDYRSAISTMAIALIVIGVALALAGGVVLGAFLFGVVLS